jgi:hypothetical protein
VEWEQSEELGYGSRIENLNLPITKGKLIIEQEFNQSQQKY